MSRNIYLIGSLRNPGIPALASRLRASGHSVFDDWYAAGPGADDAWRDYERGRGNDLPRALRGEAAHHVYNFDIDHLKRCDTAVLLCPAGRSAHLELGWVLGQGKEGYVLTDDPDRYDVMYLLATGVYTNEGDLLRALQMPRGAKEPRL